MTKTISGPFGNYPHGSVGAVLNSLCEEYCIPLSKVEDLTVSDGVLTLHGKEFGYYCWDEDGLDFIYAPSTKS